MVPQFTQLVGLIRDLNIPKITVSRMINGGHLSLGMQTANKFIGLTARSALFADIAANFDFFIRRIVPKGFPFSQALMWRLQDNETYPENFELAFHEALSVPVKALRREALRRLHKHVLSFSKYDDAEKCLNEIKLMAAQSWFLEYDLWRVSLKTEPDFDRIWQEFSSRRAAKEQAFVNLRDSVRSRKKPLAQVLPEILSYVYWIENVVEVVNSLGESGQSSLGPIVLGALEQAREMLKFLIRLSDATLQQTSPEEADLFPLRNLKSELKERHSSFSDHVRHYSAQCVY